MEGSGGRDPGYDDWFDEPAPPTQGAGRSTRGVYDEPDEEVWVVPDDDRPRAAGERREFVLGSVTLTATQAAIIAASILAIFFAALAAAGVFSGGGKPSTAGLTTSTGPPPSTKKTTSTAVVTTPSAQAPTSTLSPGDTGTQVKVLQKALNALGYSVGKADGYYGPATEASVKQFQTAKGLTADGVVGQQTLNALQQALSG